VLRASPHQRGAHALQSLSAGASVNHEAPTLAKRVKRKIENCQSEVKMSPLNCSVEMSLPRPPCWLVCRCFGRYPLQAAGQSDFETRRGMAFGVKRPRAVSRLADHEDCDSSGRDAPFAGTIRRVLLGVRAGAPPKEAGPPGVSKEPAPPKAGHRRHSSGAKKRRQLPCDQFGRCCDTGDSLRPRW